MSLAAPEVLRGEEYSHSVDWWSLGIIVYSLLAGRVSDQVSCTIVRIFFVVLCVGPIYGSLIFFVYLKCSGLLNTVFNNYAYTSYCLSCVNSICVAFSFLSYQHTSSLF